MANHCRFADLSPMSETFQIYCPSCNSKLNAKASLIGQTRNCPKCQTPIVIQQRFDLDAPVTLSSDPTESSVRRPQLDFRYRYFILDVDRLVAAWEPSKGWLVNVGSGYAPAPNNMQAIPDQGEFAFVEMTMESGFPQKLHIAKISSRGALTVLCRDAEEILNKLEEPIELTAAQKDALLQYLRQMFMAAVLDGAGEVIAYLTSSTR